MKSSFKFALPVPPPPWRRLDGASGRRLDRGPGKAPRLPGGIPPGPGRLARRRSFVIYVYGGSTDPCPAALDLHLTLLESDRSFLRFAESAFTSVVAHLAVILSAVAVTHDSPEFPTDEREARVFFLLPPDRVDVRLRQTETTSGESSARDIADGKDLAMPGEGRSMDLPTFGARGKRKGSGARGEAPFGPAPSLFPDTVWASAVRTDSVKRGSSLFKTSIEVVSTRPTVSTT